MKKTANPRTGAREHTWAIIVLMIALLVTIAAGSYYGAGDERNRYLRSYAHLSENDARKLGEHARQSFAHVELALTAAARAVTTGTSRRLRARFSVSRALRQIAASVPQIHSITVSDAKGTIRYSSLSLRGRAGRLSISPAIQAILRKGSKVGGSAIQPDPITGKRFIAISRRVGRRGSDFVGVITAYVRPSFFNKFYATSGMPKGATAALIAGDGTVLSSHPKLRADGTSTVGLKAKTVPFLSALPPLRPRGAAAQRFARDGMIGTAYRVGKQNLFVAVMAPTEAVLAPWRTGFWRKVIIVGAIGVLVCGFLLVLWWQFMQRTRSARRLVLQSAAIESAPNAMFITDRNGTITWTNAAFSNLSGYDRDEVVGRSMKILRSGKHSDQFYDDIWKKIRRGEVFRGQMINRHKDGRPYAVDQTITPIQTHGKQITYFVTVYEDITARVSAEQKILHLAHHDGLTDLPNRNLFVQRIEEAMGRVERTQKPFAILMFDLDRFKDINDTLGHELGDEVLVALSKRVSDLLRKTDVAARLGGDEFGVLLDFLADEAAAASFAERLIKDLAKPFESKGKKIALTASVGIAVFSGGETTPNMLIRNAEFAMYEAKKAGLGTFRFFDAELDRIARERIEIGRELREGLEQNQFWLALQPQIDMRSGGICGAEALLRWTHPDRGLVSPGLFIPVAEANRSILEIDDWVMRQACRELKALDLSGLPDFVMSINLSAAQYEQEDLVPRLVKTLKDHKLPAKVLEVEITETAAMSHSDTVAENVKKLEKAGVRVAIDDFGTGYSSLSYLRDFPVTRLKIDSSFVWGIGKNPRDEAIVEAVVTLAHKLGLRVLAEGVETQEHIDFLKQCGCDELQGFFISKPVSVTEFAAFVESYKPIKAA